MWEASRRLVAEQEHEVELAIPDPVGHDSLHRIEPDASDNEGAQHDVPVHKRFELALLDSLKIGELALRVCA